MGGGRGCRVVVSGDQEVSRGEYQDEKYRDRDPDRDPPPASGTGCLARAVSVVPRIHLALPSPCVPRRAAVATIALSVGRTHAWVPSV